MGIRDIGDGISIVSQRNQRVLYSEALLRLRQFPHLYAVIDDQWLTKQFQLPVDSYSLITGWLSTSDFDWMYTYQKFVASLDGAVAILGTSTSPTVWSKLRRKLRTQSDRSESKGTIAELSLAVFLAQNGISFDMETKLDSASKKDVDFSLQFSNGIPVHIEMQWLSESDKSSRAADALAPYGRAASISFAYEEHRIRGKVANKTPKLTPTDITLVALDCTSDPILGGEVSTVRTALRHVFDRSIYTALTEEETEIRRLVDAVIWFETDINTAIAPERRGSILNEYSTFNTHPSLMQWIKVWSST